MKLQQEKGLREDALEAANWRSSHGEPPTEDTEKEIQNIEKIRILRYEAIQNKERKKEMLLLHPNNFYATKTACEPRPSAYIPDDIGLACIFLYLLYFVFFVFTFFYYLRSFFFLIMVFFMKI